MATAEQDATMRVLDKLGKPQFWDKIEVGVPIFTAHREKTKDKDGNEIELVIDEKKLHRILDEIITLERSRGVLPIITEGHRVVGVPGYPESKQPDVFGVWANSRIGTFGKEKTLSILADPHYLPGKYGKAKDYPFRSAEVYLPELDKDTQYPYQLTAVALLKKDPRQNLGLVMNERQACGQFSRESQSYHFSIGEPMEPIDPEKEFEGHFSRCMAAKYPHFERFYGEGTKHYAMDTAGLHPAGPGNVTPPAAVGEEKEKKEMPPHMMERDAVLAQFEKRLAAAEADNSKLAARIVQVETEREQLRKENTFVAFERDLTQLREVEGFDIDIEDEIKTAKEDGIKPEQFAKKLDWFRKNARKLPVSHFGRQTGPDVFRGHVEGATNGQVKGKKATSKEVSDAANQRKPDEDFAVAFERVNGRPFCG
jgi:hypothetical protein